MRVLAFYVFAAPLFIGVSSITIGDVYKRLLEKERNIDNTFTFQFVKPIGSVAGELIWPRSYEYPSELFFDENGAAFNVRERPSLHQILLGYHVAPSSVNSYALDNDFRA